MINFPDSPAINQTFWGLGGANPMPRWLWDGEKWTGGSLGVPNPPIDGKRYARVYTPSQPTGNWVPAGGVSVLNLSNVPSMDYMVPADARLLRVTGSVTPPAAHYTIMRVSFDGTNFIAGASDYYIYGFDLKTGTPTPDKWQDGATSLVYLTQNGEYNPNYPATFTCLVPVTRANTTQAFTFPSWGHSFYSSANYDTITYWKTIIFGAAGANLSIKALRFANSAGSAFNSPSTICVEVLA